MITADSEVPIGLGKDSFKVEVPGAIPSILSERPAIPLGVPGGEGFRGSAAGSGRHSETSWRLNIVVQSVATNGAVNLNE